MKIAIDGNLLCGKKTGMGMVVYHVLRHWKGTEENEITVYLPEHIDDDYEKLLAKNSIKLKVMKNTNYFVWEQIILPRAVKIDGNDVLWCPYNTAPLMPPCKTVVTINDVIYMNSPLKSASSLYKKIGILYRRNVVPTAIRKASAVITISEFAKKEIGKIFPKQVSKVTVILLGSDIRDNCLTEKNKTIFFTKNKICKPYILGFGSLETRKNSLLLIQAYESLPIEIKKRYQLVLFGFRGYKKSADYKYIIEHQMDSYIRVLGYVSEEEKRTLYKESEMFVFPTQSEGFGIPVLEAFSAKTPVITSNTTSIPEVAGNAAILISPNDKKQIMEAILRILEDDTIMNEMIIAGDKQLQKFNWEYSAKKIMEVIKKTIDIG